MSVGGTARIAGPVLSVVAAISIVPTHTCFRSPPLALTGRSTRNRFSGVTGDSLPSARARTSSAQRYASSSWCDARQTASGRRARSSASARYSVCAAAQTLYRALAEERARRPLTVCLASHQLEDAYRWADDIRALAEGRLSPVTPENLFRVDLPATPAGVLKHVPVGPIAIAVLTDKSGPAILAVSPTDIFVSKEPTPSSARNVFAGRVTRLERQDG